MGKHNGKARRSGLSVGSALVNRARRDGRTGSITSHLYTTDMSTDKGATLQSVLENNDLQEMMNLAELAERDFSAEKGNVVVISTGTVGARSETEAAAERKECEANNAHRLRIPRRPKWSSETSADQLDSQERATFLEWRRDLAALEQDERLVLTPFEKNLEVWRQLWRVIERSDIVVQVVDSRDPLTYRSEDLEAYCLELHATKRTLILINKADLLPARLRSAWADYFDSLGINYVFWSAKFAADMEENGALGDEIVGKDTSEDPRARLLNVGELTSVLKSEAEKAVRDAIQVGVDRTSRGERYVVGLTGYPNVGKSSTINALFGSKKTAVAATPGKTKHFQTLNVSDDLCICDCPGLVLPQFAHSKAEMVAAGVIPIDRLTDIRAPVAAVAAKVSRDQLEKVYGLKLPKVPVGEDPNRSPTANELLRSLALSRGWVGASGLPDETRAGRRLLKDFVDGVILACTPPPGASKDTLRLVEAISGRKAVQSLDTDDENTICIPAESEGQGSDNVLLSTEVSSDLLSVHEQNEAGRVMKASDSASNAGDLILDDADLELFDSMNLSGKKEKPMRAAHKFQKKPARLKGRKNPVGKNSKDPYYDGASLHYGKRGGLVRVPAE